MRVERMGAVMRRLVGRAAAESAENVDRYAEQNVRVAAVGRVRRVGVPGGWIFHVRRHRVA